MGTPQQRRKQRSGQKLTRRTAEKHKKYQITGNQIIKANWNKKQTLLQNYRRLGLLTKLNGVAGGKEKTEVEKQETQEEKELTEEDIEKIKKTLKPGEGLIQRDDEGNVIRVIVGEQKSHDEILDEEPEPVEAKTQVVRELEEMASRGVTHDQYMSRYQEQWMQRLYEKYGDDFDAMMRDTKLNVYQHTAAQLRRKFQLYQKTHNQQEEQQ
ncbi:hypothetical protein VTP01DRAFT_8557 [Rhizomucor pusillus]|uniref:uncharacterized protein n=1 Tax=Rhizomucor pusillus TaxID=4840 RepID=UPI003741F44A